MPHKSLKVEGKIGTVLQFLKDLTSIVGGDANFSETVKSLAPQSNFFTIEKINNH